MNGAGSMTDKTEATSDKALAEQWETTDWERAQQYVNRLQARIANARRDGKLKTERRISYLLTHSFYAKALAVKQVTSTKGKSTPGVDKDTWNTPAKKMTAVCALTDKRYKAKPLRRVNIPKRGKKETRPLGIPTMYDRAMQALYLMALDPIVETVSDTNSYGFRKGRCAADAETHLFSSLANKSRATWVVEGDIKGCFDNISHEWLIQNIPMDKSVLKQFLKAGFIFEGKLFPTDSGTPQGGVISPTLANASLNGMQTVLEERFHSNPVTLRRNDEFRRRNKVTLVRYADDLVVTAATEAIAQEVKDILSAFLAERGLELSEEKTYITHIDTGFDFLGWNFRKYKGKLLIRPSKKSISRFTQECARVIKVLGGQITQGELIKMLNPKIRGWANYHRGVCASKVFSKIDSDIFWMLWRKAKRQHPTKNKGWLVKRYWKQRGNRNWVFTDGAQTLIKASDVKIRRHILVDRNMNPYIDSGYFDKRAALKSRH